MTHDQRKKGILAQSQYYNQQYTDRESGHYFRIDNRDLIGKIHKSARAFFTVKCSDGSDGSQDRCDQRRAKCQRKRSADHAQQFAGRKQCFIILQRKMPTGSDGCCIGKAVYCQDNNRQIHK